MYLRFSAPSAFICVFLSLVSPAEAQDWFRTGTGLGVEKARVAAADFAARNAPSDPGELQQERNARANTFNAVLWSDLEYSGILELVSKSFYPLDLPTIPAQLRIDMWNRDPVSAHMLALGNVSISGEEMVIEAWLFDVRSEQPPVLAKRYRATATDDEARRIAHQFADEIVARLSGGLPGIASTKIAFVSNRTGSKEIWVMDFDGAGQQALTRRRSIALTPRWSPDASRIAFTCYRRGPNGVVNAQLCMYSMETGKPVTFAAYRGTNSAPAWSPNGSQLMFTSSMTPEGDPEIFLVDALGSNPKRITFATGVDTSPAWNPKTGQQVAFVSDRGGIPQVYLMNADGTNVEKLRLPDTMGYVIDPAWSPNGQLLAFSWRRPTGNYDIYVMDVATGEIVEITRDAGRNERPSWAPDGRHIVFESTRTGSRQIWTMLADGSQPRQLTFEGANESPNWSPR